MAHGYPLRLLKAKAVEVEQVPTRQAVRTCAKSINSDLSFAACDAW